MRIMLTIGEKVCVGIFSVFASAAFGIWQYSWPAGFFCFYMIMTAVWVVVPSKNAK